MSAKIDLQNSVGFQSSDLPVPAINGRTLRTDIPNLGGVTIRSVGIG